MPSRRKHEPKSASRSKDGLKREETLEEYDVINDRPGKEDLNTGALRGWPANKGDFLESKSPPLV